MFPQRECCPGALWGRKKSEHQFVVFRWGLQKHQVSGIRDYFSATVRHLRGERFGQFGILPHLCMQRLRRIGSSR